MKKSIFSLLVILISFSLYSQSEWKIPENYVFLQPFDLQFLNSQTGIAVGQNNHIYKTINGGNSWYRISTNLSINESLLSISLPNDSIGYACGSGGTVIKTIDGGENWTSISNVPNGAFTSTHFINSDTGWVAGIGYILKTTDGGLTWNYQINNNDVLQFQAIYAINENECFAVGIDLTNLSSIQGLIMHTTNGGSTWEFQNSTVNQQLRSVFFYDSNNGFSVGQNGTILKTSNAGITWTSIGSSSFGLLNDVCFSSSFDGIIIGKSGKYLTTSDGGNTWSENNYSGYTNRDLYSINILSNTEVFVASDASIIKSTDYGNSWTRLYDGSGVGLSKLDFVDEYNGYAVGSLSTFLRTTDGGENWSRINIENIPYDLTLNSIDFITDSIGWITSLEGNIFKTLNKGDDWTEVSLPNNSLYDVHFVDSVNGWIVGAQTIYKTTNGGLNWIVIDPGIISIFLDVYFVNSLEGWITSTDGNIIHTTDGGITWIVQNTNVSNWINSIHFFNSNNGYAVGNDGLILKTIDGGQNWTIESSSTTSHLTSVFMLSENKIWAVGYSSGIIIKSNDGTNWDNQVFENFDFGNTFISFFNNSDGWVIQGGYVMNYDLCNDSSNYNFFSLPSDSTCNGSFNFSYEYAFNNSVSIDNNSFYSFSNSIEFENLCPGIYDMTLINNCIDTIAFQIVVPSFSNIIFNNNFSDSTVVDSLGVVNSNCFIDYSSIDTAYIDSLWTNGNQVNVIWNIVDSNGSNLDTTTYNLNSGTGVYWLQLSVFCPTKAVDDYFTVTQAIYFGNGTATLGVDDNFSFHENNIGLYPNPTSNSVTITFGSKTTATIQIMDAQGKFIQKNTIVSGESISLEGLEKGMYLISLAVDNQQYIERIIKQ